MARSRLGFSGGIFVLVVLGSSGCLPANTGVEGDEDLIDEKDLMSSATKPVPSATPTKSPIPTSSPSPSPSPKPSPSPSPTVSPSPSPKVSPSPSPSPSVTATPTGKPTTAEIATIFAGEYTAFYLVRGKLYGVGSNRAGEMGIGNLQQEIPPFPVALPANLTFKSAAAGFYQSAAVDMTGHVWAWGSNNHGQHGNGATGPDSAYPAKILVDDRGQDFGNVVHVESGEFTQFALKSDGTVWAWGDNSRGTIGVGDSTARDYLRPTQVAFPSGIKIKKLKASLGPIALATDGSVWTWGMADLSNRGTQNADPTRPHEVVNLPPTIVDVAGGGTFHYALTSDGILYGWGINGSYLAQGEKYAWLPIATPVKLKLVTEDGMDLQGQIAQVEVSANSTHVILEDGSLWGWGSNAQGEVGNGEELDYSKMNYRWDWGKGQLMVMKPIRIIPGVSNFKAIYTNGSCFYLYAQTMDGKLYAWGVNKTGIQSNGIRAENPEQASRYPNSWDVPLPALVDPMALEAWVPTRSPICTLIPGSIGC